MVLAVMREESEEFSASGDSMEEEVHDIYKPPHNREEAIRRSHDLTSSWDGTGSISARNRRRETNNVNVSIQILAVYYIFLNLIRSIFLSGLLFVLFS